MELPKIKKVLDVNINNSFGSLKEQIFCKKYWQKFFIRYNIYERKFLRTNFLFIIKKEK
jgi:hypothetical protein